MDKADPQEDRSEEPAVEEAWSAEHWEVWVSEQLRANEDTYTNQPVRLISDYNRESRTKLSYHGREILELIQNADDAGKRASNRACVVLSPQGLCFANTGRTFDHKGVASLLVSDNSPKQYDRGRYIGNKGLGFRAVLNWTESPFILSGNLELGFSRSQAVAWLDGLSQCNVGVAAVVADWRETKRSLPIPILAVPRLLSSQTLGLMPEEFVPVWSEAVRLREQGWETVIAMPFSKDSAFGDVQEQLGRLSREVLLFVKHLEHLSIYTPEGGIEWEVDREADRRKTTILQTGREESIQTWGMFGDEATVPVELLDEDQRDSPDYQIKLAVPEDGTTTSGVLFSYFATQVGLPLPIVVHATVELEDNRQHLRNLPANGHILKQMAAFITRTAEGYSVMSEPWRALSMITPTQSLDISLQQFSFYETLLQFGRGHRLVPTRDGQMRRPGDARLLPSQPTGRIVSLDWLPDGCFGDIVLHTNEAHFQRILRDFDIPPLSPDEFRIRLEQVSPTLSTSERARLLAGLVETGLVEVKPPPSLLINERGEVIPSGEEVFLPPEGQALVMPSDFRIHILDATLFTALQERLQGTARGIRQSFTSYGIREYSLAAIAATVMRETRKKIEEYPDCEADHRRSAIAAIYILYQRAVEAGANIERDRLEVPLPSRSGDFLEAEYLYLGEEYPDGILTEALYGSIYPQKIVAGPDGLGLDAPVKEISSFLLWLGVAKEPRITSESVRDDNAFKEFVLTSLDASLVFNYPDCDVHHPEQLRTRAWHINNAIFVDSLHELLEQCDPHAIITWIAQSPHLDDWRVHGDHGASLFITIRGKHSYGELQRHILPSYVIWLLQNTAWLPSTTGQREPPRRCTAMTRATRDLETIVPQPVIDRSNPLFLRYAIDDTRVLSVLNMLGMRRGVDDLASSEVYELLLRLPDRDPEGKAARTIYSELLLRNDTAEQLAGPRREQFLREGKLWGIQGDVQKYFPASEVFYLDKTAVADVVADRVPLLAVPKRRSTQKVKLLFGVQPLDKESLQISIHLHPPHERAATFTDEVSELKPFILALRIAEADRANRMLLREVSILLCQRVEGKAHAEAQRRC